MPTPVKIPASVNNIEEHAPDLRSFTLQLHKDSPRFRPGQFLHLALDPYAPTQHWPDSRAFSVASSPSDRRMLRITVSRKGSFTARMFEELKLESEVWVKLPYGAFTPALSDDPIVLLAGGTGVTPFVSFIQWAASRSSTSEIALHYGARTAALLVYRDALERCRERLPGLRVTYYVENTRDEASPMQRGRLSAERIWNVLSDPTRAVFYMSGPRPMIDSCRADFLKLGASQSSLLTDEWG